VFRVLTSTCRCESAINEPSPPEPRAPSLNNVGSASGFEAISLTLVSGSRFRVGDLAGNPLRSLIRHYIANRCSAASNFLLECNFRLYDFDSIAPRAEPHRHSRASSVIRAKAGMTEGAVSDELM